MNFEKLKKYIYLFNFKFVFYCLIIFWLLSGIYVQKYNSKSLIYIFNKFIYLNNKPGINYLVPYPIGKKIDIDYTQTKNTNLLEKKYITGDENIVQIIATIYWEINNINDYLNHTDDTIIKYRAESSINKIVAKYKMNDIITNLRESLKYEIQEDINKNMINTGIIINNVTLINIKPPNEVQPAFDDVVKAEQDRERIINEAIAYSNENIPKARGNFVKMINEANAYKEQIVIRAETEASICYKMMRYKDNFKKKLYLETMAEIIKNNNVNIKSNESNSIISKKDKNSSNKNHNII